MQLMDCKLKSQNEVFLASLTAKNASSKTSSGPEKPMTKTGWAATKQKMIPWMLVEIRSSETPIMLSTLSAVGGVEKGGGRGGG